MLGLVAIKKLIKLTVECLINDALHPNKYCLYFNKYCYVFLVEGLKYVLRVPRLSEYEQCNK